VQNQTPFQFDPARALGEMLAFQRKLSAGISTLRGMPEPEYANTPRELVYSEDKLRVWHFKGEQPPTAKTPMLIVYALVNTVWMTDLQADRSMVRNLLAGSRLMTTSTVTSIAAWMPFVIRAGWMRSTCWGSVRAVRFRSATPRCMRTR
jgi:hypothetical protein